MGSLEKIARALDSSQLELIAAVDDELVASTGEALMRAGDGTVGRYGDGEARMLVHGTRRFQPMEFTGHNLEVGDQFVHDEDEFIHVIAGAVEVVLGTEPPTVLREGDSLYYVGGTPHRWRALDAAGYRLFVVKEKPHQL